MVLRVPAQPDADMLCYARDLKCSESALLKSDAFGHGASIWRCATHTPGGIGFWVGHMKDDIELYAYLALIHWKLDGRPVLEGKKAWTEDAWRRKGLGRTLLQMAAQVAPLLSDSDGMTNMAFAQWNAAPGFRHRWWDAQMACFVDDTTVPPADRFTSFENGKRWLMLLELEICSK